MQPLLDGGALPNLARLVKDGVMGDVAPLTPLCPPLLWTSVSTGRNPDRHGVLDGVEDDPRTGGVRPVTRQSLAALHVWELLAAEGVRCQAVGWPATHPARSADRGGSAAFPCVSDRFAAGAEGSVWPLEREQDLLDLRFGAGEWTGADLQMFVPELGTIDQDRDRRLAKLAVALAETATNHAAATALLEGDDADLTAVWYGVAARAAELFPEATDGVYAEAVRGVYRFLDLLLGRLMELAGPEALVLLVSDRAAGEPEFHAETGTGSQGILCAGGPGITAEELVFEPGVLDVAPTLLALFGFRAPEGMPGYVIDEICPEAPTRELAGLWPASSSRSVAPAAADADDNDEMDIDVAELQAAGYQDAVAAQRRPEAVEAWVRRTLNLARVLWSQGRTPEAVPLLEAVVPVIARSPTLAKYADARLYLGTAYLESGRVADARRLAEELLRTDPDSPLAPLAAAHLAMAAGDLRGASEALRVESAATGVSPVMDVALGNALLRVERWDDAAAAFRSALRVDRRMLGALSGLALALLGAARFEEAAEAALDAVRLQHRQPAMHDVLGRSLQQMGRQAAAAAAFAVRDSLQPVPHAVNVA